MNKRILTVCAALVAFAAFAIAPAIAAASPELQTSGGTKVEVGTEIKATNSGNTKLTTASGNVECTTASLEGKVTDNSGTHIEGTISGGSFTGSGPESRCTSTISDLLGGTITVKVTPTFPMCLTAGGTLPSDVFKITGGDCTGGSVVFHLDVFTHFGGSQVTTCTYERASVEGTFNTSTSPLTLTTAASQSFTKTAGSSLCPASGTLDATFVLKTSAGGELKVV